MNLHSRKKVQRKKLAFAVDHVWTSRAEKQRGWVNKECFTKKKPLYHTRDYFTCLAVLLSLTQWNAFVCLF